MAADPYSNAQPATANYDEAKVPSYTLPDLLVCEDGMKVQSKADWEHRRRAEILNLFATEMYGKVPDRNITTSYHTTFTNTSALDGKATMKNVEITFSNGNRSLQMDLLIYIPNNLKAPAPVFLGLNFNGNHTIIDDPSVPLPAGWVPESDRLHVTNHKASALDHGADSSRWPVGMLIDAGYGVATVYSGDIDPDFDDPSNGIQSLYYNNGQQKPDADQWGTIAAWAWGLSRAMDYLETDKDINHEQVVVIGHSRLGKTALWAGASDPRFAMVISNDSGCGGAALSRRAFGETVKSINDAFPYWFCDNFKKYNDREEDLPVDQHMLIALIAPRPIYVASASEDLWADPKGEYLSLYNAQEVYRLYDPSIHLPQSMPGIDNPVHTLLMGRHLRAGGHDITSYDWQQYLDFANV